jgi:hypothetical protein
MGTSKSAAIIFFFNFFLSCAEQVLLCGVLEGESFAALAEAEAEAEKHTTTRTS